MGAKIPYSVIGRSEMKAELGLKLAMILLFALGVIGVLSILANYSFNP